MPSSPEGSNAPAIHRVNMQQDVYPIYKSAGIRGAKIIHLNRFFNMQGYSPREKLRTTNFPLPVSGFGSLYEQGVDSHSWLFIATRTGLVRTVTTVLPDYIFQERVKDARRGDIFAFSEGVVRGYTFDTPRTIAAMDTLPATDEPVIVNVDAGFFSGNADPVRTAAALKKKCRDIRTLVLIGSIDEPEVTDFMREQLRQFETAWRRQ